MKYAGDRRYLVYPEESGSLVKLVQMNMHFKVTKSVVCTSKKKKNPNQVLVTAWGIVALKAVG